MVLANEEQANNFSDSSAEIGGEFETGAMDWNDDEDEAEILE